MKAKELKAKSCLAYAIVNRKNPKIRALEIYQDKDIMIGREEKIIRVKIEEV